MDDDVDDLIAGAPDGEKIAIVVWDIAKMLLTKNAAYGNSALDPVRIFARNLDAEQQLLVRIDDKLSRLSRGENTHLVPEDTIMDLVGYLVLLLVARGRGGPSSPPQDGT